MKVRHVFLQAFFENIVLRSLDSVKNESARTKKTTGGGQTPLLPSLFRVN